MTFFEIWDHNIEMVNSFGQPAGFSPRNVVEADTAEEALAAYTAFVKHEVDETKLEIHEIIQVKPPEMGSALLESAQGLSDPEMED